jgi:hypothetical protein
VIVPRQALEAEEVEEADTLAEAQEEADTREVAVVANATVAEKSATSRATAPILAAVEVEETTAALSAGETKKLGEFHNLYSPMSARVLIHDFFHVPHQLYLRRCRPLVS